MNLYTYVGGDPANFVDPTGMARQVKCTMSEWLDDKGQLQHRITCVDAGGGGGGSGWANQLREWNRNFWLAVSDGQTESGREWFQRAGGELGGCLLDVPCANTMLGPLGQVTAARSAMPISRGDARHIFRAAPGHLAVDNPANRRLLQSAVTSRHYVGTDRWGTHVYARQQPDGTQIWARVRDGQIRYGGVNQTPRSPAELLQ